jgi:predicted porin
MDKIATSVFILGTGLTLGANADSDIAGHSHAGSPDHHTMHDQLSDKSWEFYGALYASLQSNDAGKAAAHNGNKSQRNTFLTTDGTTLGFRGAIPLEAGLKAVWQIESTINFDEFRDTASHNHGTQPPNYNNSTLAGGHNSFLGLSGHWGTVLVGKHNTPFFDASIQFDLFHHLPGDVRAILGRIPGAESGTGDHHGGTFNVSASDMIMYKSPKMNNGFSFEGAVFALNETLENESSPDPSAFGLGARWEQPKYTLVAAYEEHKNFDSFDDDGDHNTDPLLVDKTTGVILGGMVHFNNANSMVGVFVEQLKTDAASTSIPDKSRNGYSISLQQRYLNKNKIKLAYSKADELESKDGGQMVAIGVARLLGERTEVYATYAKTDNDVNAKYSNGTIGPLGKGGDPTTLAFGIVHMF